MALEALGRKGMTETCGVSGKDSCQTSLSSVLLSNRLTSEGIAVAMGSTRHLKGCGLGDRGARQNVADHMALSVLVAPTSEPWQGFSEHVCLGLTDFCRLFRAVSLGSHLRAWALWEGDWRQPTGSQH